MNIHICAVKQLYRLVQSGEIDPNRTAAVISSSYPISESKLGTMPYVFCQYDDVDHELPGRSFPPKTGAEHFASFLKGISPKITDLYCCCDGGCRRSVAVACAAMLHFQQDDMVIWRNPLYEPNVLVFELLCEALGLPLTDGDLDYRMESRNEAFKNAMKR